MLKKLQISLLYLSMLVILGHGLVPHHHHKDFSEPECTARVIHLESHHACDLSTHEHSQIPSLVCHFQVVTYKLSLEKFFLPTSGLRVVTSDISRLPGKIAGYLPPLTGMQTPLPCFLRAPPMTA